MHDATATQTGVDEMGKQMADAFYRGFDDFNRGLTVCPFKIAHKVEAWVDGWKTAKHTYAR